MSFLSDIKLFAFDCDGVIFDSREANRDYYNHLLKSFDLPLLSEEDLDLVFMETGDKAREYLFKGRVDLKKVDEERRKFDYHQLFSLMIEEKSLRPLLNFLRPNYLTAVATNRADTIKPLLKHFKLDSYFDLIVGSLDVERPKPYPDMLLLLADHFKIKSENILYIGDSILDAKAAREAGCPFAAYGSKDIEADLYIDKLSELSDLLKNS